MNNLKDLSFSPSSPPSPPPLPTVERLLAEVAGLSAPDRSRFLRKLVRRCSRNISEMNFLRSLVQAVPASVGLDRLPAELVGKILGELDPVALIRLARTSRRWWQTVWSDGRIWKDVFEAEKLSGRVSEPAQRFHAEILERLLLAKGGNSCSRAATLANTAATGSLVVATAANTSTASKSNLMSYQHDHQQQQQQQHVRTRQPYLINPHIQAVHETFKFERVLLQNWATAAPQSPPIGFDCHGSHVITCMEIDTAGKFIVTGSDDGTARLWNAQNGQEMFCFAGHLGGVWALKVDWRTGLLVTGSTDRTLIIWSLWSGERLFDLLGHTSTVRCVELADEGRLIVSGSRDGTLRVWDTQNGNCLHLLQGHAASVRCLSLFGEDCVISGSYDNDCRLWNIKTGTCLAVLSGHTNKVYAVTSSGTSILSGSLDGTVKIWDPRTGACQQTLLGHRSLVGLVLAKPELRRSFVVSGSTDGSLQLINPSGVGQGHPASHVLIPLAHETSITSLDFNRRFMITGSEGLVRLWSLPENGSSGPGEPKPLAKLADAMDMVWRVGVSESLAVVAYQLKGQTRLAILNFTPTPEQLLHQHVPLHKLYPVQPSIPRNPTHQMPLFGNVFHDVKPVLAPAANEDDEVAFLALFLAEEQRRLQH